jgi:hypothetical protein
VSVITTSKNFDVVPGLNTLGPGVKDQLACMSCDDCRFATDGCKMLSVVRTQAELLTASYCAPEVSHGN